MRRRGSRIALTEGRAAVDARLLGWVAQTVIESSVK